MVGNFMIRKVSPLNAAFLGIRKPATKVSNNMNKMFANASGLRKRKVWNLKQKLSGNFSQSFLCDVAEFKEKHDIASFGRSVKIKNGRRFDQTVSDNIMRSSVNRMGIKPQHIMAVRSTNGRLTTVSRNYNRPTKIEAITYANRDRVIQNHSKIFNHRLNQEPYKKSFIEKLKSDYSPHKWVQNEKGSYVKKLNPKFFVTSGLGLAGLGATGYGAYKTYKHFKNKNKGKK